MKCLQTIKVRSLVSEGDMGGNIKYVGETGEDEDTTNP